MRLILAAFPLFSLAACATPEARVRTALLEAGLSRPIAACMAQRMVDRLSLAQLQQLSRASQLEGKPIGELTIRDFVRRAASLRDPEIVRVVTSAGLGCAIAS